MLRAINYPLMLRPVRRDPSEVPAVVVTTADDMNQLGKAVATADAVAVDTETHDATVLPNGMWAEVRVITIATRHGEQYAKYLIDRMLVDDKLIAETMGRIECAIAWNANFDDQVTRLCGFPVKKWRDAMFDDAVYWTGIDGRSWYLSLAVAAKRYLGYEMSGKGSVQTSFDAGTPLSEDQINYAADDALLTLWISEILTAKLEEHGLAVAADLEQHARPFISQMGEVGFPFALAEWQEHLKQYEVKQEDALARIASLTGESGDKPSWNPDSDVQLKTKLNTFAPEIIEKRFGRPLDKADQVDKPTMTELAADGCELAASVLAFRSASKFLTTYGENIVKYVRDGRVNSEYKQVLTATARLSSSNPNAQNWPGATKDFIVAPEGRVMIVADFSAAELRVLGAVAECDAMLSAFSAGKDLHAETVRSIWGIDLAELNDSDPKEAKALRTKAKIVNFGLAYKMGAAALARTLTNAGVPTTIAEGQNMIDKVMEARPAMASYLKGRDSFVDGFAKDSGPIDWEASFRLLDAWQRFDAPRRSFKRTNKRMPTSRELAELVDHNENSQPSLFEVVPSDDERAANLEDDVALIEWAFMYDAPVVLRPAVVDPDGTKVFEPVGFESRTQSGRRRIFTVVMDSGYKRSESQGNPGVGGDRSSSASNKFDGVVTAAMLLAASTDNFARAQVRDKWAQQNGFADSLPQGSNRCAKRDGESQKEYRMRAREFANNERTRCVKAFEGQNRIRKTEFVRHMLEHVGPDGSALLLRKSFEDCVRKMGPAARNHPIQGGVADVVQQAFGDLWELRKRYPDLKWIQSVHDSIMGEVDEANGKEVAIEQRRIMERAMETFFTNVAGKVDAEVAKTQGHSGILYEVTDADVAETAEAA